MASFTYFHSLIPDPNLEKFAVAVALGGGLIALGGVLTRRLATPQGLQAAVVPEPRLSLFGVFDFFVEKFTKFHDSILGKENRVHVPFCAGIFLFIFLANALGLIPGMPAITTTVWVNVAMALVVFVYFNLHGIRQNGLAGYLKHFAGPVIWLAWLIFPLEVLSTVIRVLTLNLRLYWNISADHILLGIFTDLVPIGLPVLFLVLGLFVSFMQALVFSVLTMVYILLASSHESSHEHHDLGDDEEHGAHANKAAVAHS